MTEQTFDFMSLESSVTQDLPNEIQRVHELWEQERHTHHLHLAELLSVWIPEGTRVRARDVFDVPVGDRTTLLPPMEKKEGSTVGVIKGWRSIGCIPHAHIEAHGDFMFDLLVRLDAPARHYWHVWSPGSLTVDLD